MRLVLIGFMGAGKSTVGSLLASQLGLKFIELDQIVIERSQCHSIAELVDSRGEAEFRTIEAQAARECSHVTDAVISTGGGIIGRQENFTSLVTEGSTIVFLRTSFETVCSRIGSGAERPLFRDKAKAKALFDERQVTYEKWASISVDTDGISIDEVAANILQELKKS